MSQTETAKAVAAEEADPLTPRGHNRLPRGARSRAGTQAHAEPHR